MKTLALAGLLSLSTALPFPGLAAGTLYDVSWPADYVEGTFTLDVGTAFTTYFSTTAQGTYAWPDGLNPQPWTGVELYAQPTFTEVRFYYAPATFVGYAVSPSYIGQSSPFATAAEAWQDLITAGARDGVAITVVPEPSAWSLIITGLPLLMLTHRQIGMRHIRRGIC
jgi:hypothetical protein